MTPDDRPVIVAFDGSPAAEEAARTAASLFPGRRLVVTSVWQPGLALMMASTRDPTGLGSLPPGAEETATIDRLQRDHALEVAEVGARHVRELGGDAEALPVADEMDVAETLVAVAERSDACAVVVGSRGLHGVKSHLLGSTSRALLRDAKCPVVVVRAQ